MAPFFLFFLSFFLVQVTIIGQTWDHLAMGMAYLSSRYVEINTAFKMYYERLRDLNLFLVYLSPFYSTRIKINNCYLLFNAKRMLHRVEMVIRLVIY
jgi:hypothetical protein